MGVGKAVDSQVKVLIKAAVQKHQAGQLAEAESIYSQILQTQPDEINTFKSLEQLYPLIWTDFGTVLQKQGKLKTAVNAYQKALSLDPTLGDALYNLTQALKQQGQSAEAIQACQSFLSQQPDNPQAYNNLGNALKDCGKLSEAVHAYQQALALTPQSAEIHNNLGNLWKEQGDLKAAARAYRQAIELDPELAEAYINLGNIFRIRHKLSAAVRAYQQALTLNPNLAEVYYNLGVALKAQGKTVAASQAHQRALKLNPHLAEAKFALCITQLPVIYSSAEAIQASRTQYEKHLNDLIQHYRSATLAEQASAAKAVGSSQPYYLAYQGQNDQDLQKRYGELICHLMASRYPQWSQPLQPRLLKPHEKVRVGFVSGFFCYHSIWKIPLKGWLENLDKSDFELFGYYTSAKKDSETQAAQKALDKFVQGIFSVAEWVEIIRQDQLDALIFPEFGMEPMTLKLGCLKLAPVQIAFGGHPETSGLPTIDYHLTSDLMEPENGQEHYTETLVRLPNLAVCYAPVKVQPQTFTKQALGLRETDILFWCCQSLYKYLPQHDDMFPRIAEKVGNCRFLFIKHPGDNTEIVTNTFLQRLDQAFDSFGLDYKKYCVLLSRLNRSEFAGVTAVADIFLDSIGWSGNNTAMESADFDLPMVTLPGKMMRGRHVMAILKRMEINETIASSKDEYIEIAVRLAKNRDYRQQIVQKIARNKHKLYNDLTPVKALEEFLIKAIKKL